MQPRPGLPMWRVPGVVAGRPEQPSRQSNSPASLSLCVLAKGTNWGKTPLERPLLPSASQASSTVTTASVPLLAYTLAPLRQRHSLIGACCVTERRYVERFSSRCVPNRRRCWQAQQRRYGHHAYRRFPADLPSWENLHHACPSAI
ncbi:hypothetical protein VTN96DRAFT_5130 [Rasamsonia emersonii]